MPYPSTDSADVEHARRRPKYCKRCGRDRDVNDADLCGLCQSLLDAMAVNCVEP